MKKGLNEADIMVAAMKLVEEKGYDNFSLRELAYQLDVKPASLYNHIKGIEEINAKVAMSAASKMSNALREAIEGKENDEAFLDATRAYRRFAMDNSELYKALIRMPASDNEKIVHAAMKSFEPLRELIHSYGKKETELIHFIRALRSVMHGFFELTSSGFMRKESVTRDETYERIIQSYLVQLKGLSDK